MAIPMEIPAALLRAVIDGRAVRYGCVVKDGATGRILGHLKEVGRLSETLASIPLGPVTTAVQIGQWIDTHGQLRHIRQTLDHLQLISSVGAVASVVGLGVSVAGFALVLRRLDRLESGLNAAMGKLQSVVERLHLKLDLLQMAELRTAWEQLTGADRTTPGGRRDDLLASADRVFQKYRHYYHALIRELAPVMRAELPLPQARELYGRFFACCQAELEANLALGDFDQWFFRHDRITAQCTELGAVAARDIIHTRIDGSTLFTDAERTVLGQDAVLTAEFCRENRVRLATSDAEARWLEKAGIAPAEYLGELHQISEPRLIFVPHAS